MKVCYLCFQVNLQQATSKLNTLCLSSSVMFDSQLEFACCTLGSLVNVGVLKRRFKERGNVVSREIQTRIKNVEKIRARQEVKVKEKKTCGFLSSAKVPKEWSDSRVTSAHEKL